MIETKIITCRDGRISASVGKHVRECAFSGYVLYGLSKVAGMLDFNIGRPCSTSALTPNPLHLPYLLPTLRIHQLNGECYVE